MLVVMHIYYCYTLNTLNYQMIAVDYYINGVLYMVDYSGDGVVDGHISVALCKDIVLQFLEIYDMR
jgi:hypothetical protein